MVCDIVMMHSGSSCGCLMMDSAEKPASLRLYMVPSGCKPCSALQCCCPHCPHMQARTGVAAPCCCKAQGITSIDEEVVAQHGATVPVDGVECVSTGGQQRQLPIPPQRPRKRPHVYPPAQPQALNDASITEQNQQFLKCTQSYLVRSGCLAALHLSAPDPRCHQISGQA